MRIRRLSGYGDTATRGDVAGRCGAWCGVWGVSNGMFEDAVDAGVSMDAEGAMEW